MRANSVAIALASALVLSACGIKGPLYMAEPVRPQQPVEAEADNHNKPDFKPASIPSSSR